MKTQINIKLLISLSLTFILFTVIGTVSHELGHLTVAKYLGYNTTLHYGSMSYHSDRIEKLNEIYKESKIAKENGREFEFGDEYTIGIEKLNRDRLIISLGGPIQTIITGLIGLVIILWRRKKIKIKGLAFVDWLAIFLCLFWLREVFNLVMSVSTEIISPNGSYFGGDEKKIAILLDLWPGIISIFWGVIGLIISLFVIFRVIPLQTRLTFILSGLIGGSVGFVLWMKVLGPGLIP